MENPDSTFQSPAVVAAYLYMSDRRSLNFDEVARRSGTSADDLRSIYPVMADLLRSYYTDALSRYRLMESAVPEFGSYTLAEKMATLVFSYSDELEVVGGYAAETYQSSLHDAKLKQNLANGVQRLVHSYLASDEQISPLVRYIPGLDLSTGIQKVVVWLIKERIFDLSIDKEQSAALTDKTCTLIQSLLYTGTVDHAIDFFRYLAMTYEPKVTQHE